MSGITEAIVHLTDDQIDDSLIGDLADEPALHLAACQPCQGRVAEMKATLDSFRDVSLAWSERRSSTLSSRPDPAAVPTWGRRAVWAATAAAALAVGVAIPGLHARVDHAPNVAETDAAVLMTAEAERQEQIAKDNKMLEAISSEVNVSVMSPAEAFGLETVSGPNQTRRHTAQLRN